MSAYRHPVRTVFVSLAVAACCTTLLAQQPYSVQGVTEPLRQAVISADFAGSVALIRADEGTAVKKGDTILALDYEAARLDAERCRVIAESRAELEAAKLKMETAKLDRDATKLLFDSTRSISEEELWKKELEYNLARTEFDRLTMTKEKEKIEYRIALDHVRRFFVIAPFDGVVAQRFLNLAETCKAQEPLIKIVDVHKVRFITYVPAARSQGLTRGRAVSLSLGGTKTLRARRGIVEFVSPVVDASSGLRTVKVVFDNSDGSIQPGVNGTMLIEE